MVVSFREGGLKEKAIVALEQCDKGYCVVLMEGNKC